MYAAPPEVADHSNYLADKGVLAMIELGLEATLREYTVKRGQMYTSPTAYLASWLMRNNPKHSKEGAEMVECFLASSAERDALADVSQIESNLEDAEDAEREAAAVRMQASARRHAAKVARGEQAKAATSLQAAQRGRLSRRHQAEEAAAATKVQATIRGKAVRAARGAPAATAAAEVDEPAAADMDETKAATSLQAMHRGRAARQQQAEEAAAATKVQSVYRGHGSRARQ